MMNRRSRGSDFGQNDAEFRSFLKHHDPIAHPSALDLVRLEQQILAKVGTMEAAIPSEFVSPWMISKKWLLGGVVAGVFCILLGFSVGQDFDDVLSQSSDSISLFASASDVPWQSFDITPLSTGESDGAQQ